MERPVLRQEEYGVKLFEHLIILIRPLIVIVEQISQITNEKLRQKFVLEYVDGFIVLNWKRDLKMMLDCVVFDLSSDSIKVEAILYGHVVNDLEV